jgi:hypothetical protein
MKIQLRGILPLQFSGEYKREIGIKEKMFNIDKDKIFNVDEKNGFEMSLPFFEERYKKSRIKSIKFGINFNLLRKEKKEELEDWTVTGFRVVFLPCDVRRIILILG